MEQRAYTVTSNGAFWDLSRCGCFMQCRLLDQKAQETDRIKERMLKAEGCGSAQQHNTAARHRPLLEDYCTG